MSASRHDRDASQHAPEGKQLATLVNRAFRAEPTLLTATAITTAISAPISAYSIAVTPDSSAQKELASWCRRFICGCLLCRIDRLFAVGSNGSAGARSTAPPRSSNND